MMMHFEKYNSSSNTYIPFPNKSEEFKSSFSSKKTITKNLNDIQFANNSEKSSEEYNGTFPILKSTDFFADENDLVNLNYLNEDAVLQTLKSRFLDRQEIYTYCGVILIAINPYTDLPIYGPEFMEAYSQTDTIADEVTEESHSEPHIFAIANNALSQMKLLNQNQSIIISGESGSGKTVSAKQVLQYFATISGYECRGNATLRTSAALMKSKVLDSCPLLEALGNAKTVRNDNSSRFGKYLEVGFSRRYRVAHASIKTYLLEKSRVVSQVKEVPGKSFFGLYTPLVMGVQMPKEDISIKAPGERGYHGFYQLIAASSNPSLREEHLFLEKFELVESLAAGCEMSANRFHYINQGSCNLVTTIDDLECFKETIDCLKSLDFKPVEIELMFTVLAAILHLGNVDYSERANESSEIRETSAYHLEMVTSLLQCQSATEEVRQRLCSRVIRSVSGNLCKPLDVHEAVAARDAIAKHLYQALFQWVVTRCNQSLQMKQKLKSSTRKRGTLSSLTNFIGVLDIYGFEIFESNSFEQLCINFANEKLQQRFIKHVFKLEQDDYVREGLQWNYIDFCDNQPCIDLIEGSLGILTQLNDECKLPNPSNDRLLSNIVDQQLADKNTAFKQTKLNARTHFIISHYAENVEYTIAGFVEKNCDRIIEEHIELFFHTESQTLIEMLESYRKLQRVGSTSSTSQKTTFFRRGLITRPTVATQFTESMNELLDKLDKTTVHYVRCIKPNDNKQTFSFCHDRIAQQLRACGILQTVQISAAGYPSRWPYEEFFNRYWQLSQMRNSPQSKSLKSECCTILQTRINNADKYRLGKSKVFFADGVLLHLERIRTAILVEAGLVIQRYVRGWLARRRYQKKRQQIILLQSVARRWLARQRVIELRCRQPKITQRLQCSVNPMEEENSDLCEETSICLSLKPLPVDAVANRSLFERIEELTKRLADAERRLQQKEDFIKEMKNSGNKVKMCRTPLPAKSRGLIRVFSQLVTLERNEPDDSPNMKQNINGDDQCSIYDYGDGYSSSSSDCSDIKSKTEEVSNSLSTQVDTLQRQCEVLLYERDELYNKLEAYQESYSVAQSRNLANQKSLRCLQDMLDRATKTLTEKSQRHSARVQSNETDADLENLTSILEVQKQASRRLQKEVEQLTSENAMLKEGLQKQTLEQRKTADLKLTQDTSLNSNENRNRLISDNLELVNRLEAINSQYRQTMLSLRFFAELAYQSTSHVLPITKSPYLMNAQELINIAQTLTVHGAAQAVTPKDYEYCPGLIRCVEGKEDDLVYRLIKDLEVNKAKEWSPLIIARLIFLVVRGSDELRAEKQVSRFLSGVIQMIQCTVKNKNPDLETLVFWFVNGQYILSCLKRYSCDPGCRTDISKTEEIYCLRNFDLSSFWPIFSDLNFLTFQLLMTNIREHLLPTSVCIAALLEFEPITKLRCRVFRGTSFRKLEKKTPFNRVNTWQTRKPHQERFFRNLEKLHDLLTVCGADRFCIWCTFYQVFYYIASSTLNAMMLRKDLCNWARGAQICYNLASLETWLSEKELIPDSSCKTMKNTSFSNLKINSEVDEEIPGEGQPLRDLIDPLIQACRLLQSKKGNKDANIVKSICQLCQKLTITQITKLLSMYSPVDGYEESISSAFLKELKERLQKLRGDSTSLCFGIELDQKTLLLESSYQFPNIPILFRDYRPSPEKFSAISDLTFPPGLNISNFVKPM